MEQKYLITIIVALAVALLLVSASHVRTHNVLVDQCEVYQQVKEVANGMADLVNDCYADTGVEIDHFEVYECPSKFIG